MGDQTFATAAEKVVAVAKSALGMPVEYGGAGPGSFDTSGLVYFCFSECGISAPRLVSAQSTFGTAVEKDDLQPGDVVFFSIDQEGVAEYVGIYIGNGSFIAARSSTSKVEVLSMGSSYFTERYVCARRFT